MEIIINQLSAELKLTKKQVQVIIDLLDDGNTVPFIARYRKEMTGGASDEVLRDFEERLGYLRNLSARKEEVIRIISEQGKLTDKLKKDIEGATVLQRIEDLYRPFKAKKSTRASKAKDAGLEPLALLVMESVNVDFDTEAVKYFNEDAKMTTVAKVKAGVSDIIAEMISDAPEYRDALRNLLLQKGELESKAVDKEAESVYELYYEYAEALNKVASHRVLAIDRAEKEKFIKAKLSHPEEETLKYLVDKTVKQQEGETLAFLHAAIEDAYKRLIKPSLEREVRKMLTDKAQEEAIQVFGKNTKPLLLVPPVKDVRVLAIDPSFRTGCKLTALDETGKLLAYATVYPNAPQHRVDEAKKKMLQMIKQFALNVISIGNGTASRETEQIVAQMISEANIDVAYTIVSEAGASVYSASKLANDEYPDLDVSIRGAISIGRRLQDPLAELVKIDPKSIGVGQYQHDLNQKKLSTTLTNVVEDCVNSVGVDLNTATPSLLAYVAGISGTIAKNIVNYRDENGKFTSRAQLKKVARLGPKVYEQCAGFLRIPSAKNPLDNSAVHPESYKAAKALLERLGYKLSDIGTSSLNDIQSKIADMGRVDVKVDTRGAKGFEALKALKEAQNTSDNSKKKYESGLQILADELEIGMLSLKDIISEIQKPGRDPREEMPKPIFRSDILSFEDLSAGMELDGTVRNVVAFGAFVDIGVKQDGLVHISELSDRFVKDPMQVVSVGDQVKVKILDVDKKRMKISLTMKGVKQS